MPKQGRWQPCQSQYADVKRYKNIGRAEPVTESNKRKEDAAWLGLGRGIQECPREMRRYFEQGHAGETDNYGSERRPVREYNRLLISRQSACLHPFDIWYMQASSRTHVSFIF